METWTVQPNEITTKDNIISRSMHENRDWHWVLPVLYGIRGMVFNATFNNISVISWWSVLLMDETGVPWENHRPATSHWQTLSHNDVSSTPRLLVMTGTDCIGSCKSTTIRSWPRRPLHYMAIVGCNQCVNRESCWGNSWFHPLKVSHWSLFCWYTRQC